MANQEVKSEKSETKILETLFINDPSVHFWITQCANQDSNKVERYSKTNCTGLTGMPQGVQIYFVWNPSK